MWNKKSIAVVFTGLLIFALFVSGGCLGDGDSNNSSQKLQKMAVIGKLTDEDVATLKEENIELVSYSKENLQKTRAVLVSKMDNVTDEQKADIKEMFDENKPAVVSVYEPASAEKITELKTMVLGAKNKDNAIIKEDSLGLKNDGTKDETARVRLYSISKDAKGNTHSLAGVIYNTKAKFDALQQNDNIRQDDIDDNNIVWVKYDKETGKYNVLNYERTPEKTIAKASGSEEVKETILFYSVKEEVLGQVAESDIHINDNNIKVDFNGEKECLSVEKENELYLLLRQNIELPSGEATRVEKIVADGEDTPKTGELTEKAKMLRANKESLKQFAAWLREKKLTTEDLLADAGYIKPKTRFEKFIAWAKDLLGSTGQAFAVEAVDLYEVAHTYTGQVFANFGNLPGFTMTVNSNIISLHEFVGSDATGGNDIYYVTENCIFTNNLDSYYKRHWYENASYSSRIAEANNDSHKYYPNGAECDEGYLNRYLVETELNGDCAVVGHWSQPDTYNNVTTTSVTHGWNIGASANVGVGYVPGGTGSSSGGAKPKPNAGLSLTGGYNSSKTESYQTQDIQAVEYDNSNTAGSPRAKIKIDHIVNKIPQRASTWYKLTYPAELATSTYNPLHKFIWQMATAHRDKYKDGYKVKVTASVCGAYSKCSGSQKPEYYTMYPVLSGNIEMPVPPRFCLDKDIVNFDDSEKKTDHIVVYSQGKWEIDKDTVPTWLVLTGENTKQLTIEPQPNETGKTREAYLTVRRVGGDEDFDTRTIQVTQSMYSK